LFHGFWTDHDGTHFSFLLLLPLLAAVAVAYLLQG